MATFGLIGFGDVNSALARGLHERYGAPVPVYCAGSRHRPPYDPAFREWVEAQGGTLVERPADLAERADALVSAVVPAAALGVVEAFAPHLDARHSFFDLNSCAPTTKRAMAELVNGKGARFTDAALLGSPRLRGLRLPFVVSGDGAEHFRELTAPLGFEVDVLDRPAGAAALVKMLRSILMKGTATLAIELLVAAQRAGVVDELVQYAFGAMDREGFTNLATWFVRSTCVHAGRRVGELDEVLTTLRDYDTPTFTAEATQRWLATIASLGLKEQFGGEPPADYRVALAALDARLPRGQRTAARTEDGGRRTAKQ